MTGGRGCWLIACIAMLGGCSYSGSIEVEGQWLRAGPPNARMLAAYADLTNNTDKPVAFVTFTSTAFAAVELHETVISEGVAKMRRIRVLELGPGENATLQPGGLHLMLMRPAQPLRAGDQVTIQFVTGDGEVVAAEFPVRAP